MFAFPNGLVLFVSQAMWILDETGVDGPKIIRKEITYVPGLYKIFDEILGERERSSVFLNLTSFSFQ